MKNRIIQGGVSVAIRQVVSFPLNAIGLFISTRVLLPEDFGLLAILTPLTVFAVILADLGTSKALVQAEALPSRKVIWHIHILKLLGALTAYAVILAISPFLVGSLSLPATAARFLPYAAVIAWLQSLRTYHAAYLQRNLAWTTLAKIEMGEILVYNVVLIASAFLLRSAWAFVFGLGTRHFVGVIATYTLRPGRETKGTEAKGITSIEPLLRFGIPLQGTELFGILNGLVNPIAIGGLLGVSAVGLVNWSMNITAMPRIPVQPLPASLFSVLSERRRHGKRDDTLLSGLNFVGTAVMAFISLLLVLFLAETIGVLFGPSWEDAIPVLLLLMLTNIIIFPTWLVVAQLTAHGYSVTWFLSNVIGTSLLWSVTWGVSQLFGIAGFAVGSLVSSLIALVYLSEVASRRLGFQIRWTDTLYVLACALLATISAHRFFGATASSPFLSGMIAVGSGAAIFSPLLLPLVYRRRLELLEATAVISQAVRSYRK